MLFVAPVVSGDGPRFIGELPAAFQVHGLRARAIGGDVLLEGYLQEK
jgi:hypothetical protein